MSPSSSSRTKSVSTFNSRMSQGEIVFSSFSEIVGMMLPCSTSLTGILIPLLVEKLSQGRVLTRSTTIRSNPENCPFSSSKMTNLRFVCEATSDSRSVGNPSPISRTKGAVFCSNDHRTNASIADLPRPLVSTSLTVFPGTANSAPPQSFLNFLSVDSSVFTRLFVESLSVRDCSLLFLSFPDSLG